VLGSTDERLACSKRASLFRSTMPYNKELPTGPGNYHGIYLHTKSQKFQAKTTTKPQEYIGSYGDEESAARAWDDYMLNRKGSKGPFNFLVLQNTHESNSMQTKQRAGVITSTNDSSRKVPAVAAAKTNESNDITVANILADLAAPSKGNKIGSKLKKHGATNGTVKATSAASSKAGGGTKASSEKGRDSKFKYGVRWHKRDKRWIARAQIDGKNTYIGSFLDEEQAALAYDKRVACLGHPLNFQDVENAVASSTSVLVTSRHPESRGNERNAIMSKPGKEVSKKCKSTSGYKEGNLLVKSLPSASKRKRESTSGEEPAVGFKSDKEEISDGDELMAELVWVKYASSPWWPARIAKPKPEHFELKPSNSPSGTELKFVVFYGNRPSCAWLPEKNIKPFRNSRNIYAPRCKTGPFNVALKQADAEALKQTLSQSERPRNAEDTNQMSKPLNEVNLSKKSAPSASIRTFVHDLRHPLGISTKELSLVVAGVASKSSSHDAGIKPGDRICKIGDIAVSNFSDVESAIATFQGRGLHEVTVSFDDVEMNDLSGPRSKKRSEGSILDGDKNKSDSNASAVEDNFEDGNRSLKSSGELVWAKHLKSPWWPAQVGKPNEDHMKIKPREKSSVFVLFLGSRRSCAWVCEELIKPFHTERAVYASQCKTNAFLISLRQADAVAQKQAAGRLERNQKKQKVEAEAESTIETGNNLSEVEENFVAIDLPNALQSQRGIEKLPQTPPTPKYTSGLIARSQGASTPNLTSATSTEPAYFSKELKASSNTTTRTAEQSSSSSSSTTEFTSLNSGTASNGRSLSLLLSPLHRARTSAQPSRSGRRNILTASALSLLPAGPPSNATIEALRESDSGLRWLSAPWTGLWTRSGGGPGSV